MLQILPDGRRQTVKVLSGRPWTWEDAHAAAIPSAGARTDAEGFAPGKVRNQKSITYYE